MKRFLKRYHDLQWRAAGKYSEHAFQALDYILDEASKYGVRLLLTLVNNWDNADSKTQARHLAQHTQRPQNQCFCNHVCSVVVRAVQKLEGNLVHVESLDAAASLLKTQVQHLAWHVANLRCSVLSVNMLSVCNHVCICVGSGCGTLHSMLSLLIALSRTDVVVTKDWPQFHSPPLLQQSSSDFMIVNLGLPSCISAYSASMHSVSACMYVPSGE